LVLKNVLNNMYKRNKIGIILLSFLLNAIILFPIFIQFLHASEEHEHLICYDDSTHLHEIKSNCDICDFTISPFALKLINNTNSELVESYYKAVNNHYNFLYSSYVNTTKKLRGPPTYS